MYDKVHPIREMGDSSNRSEYHYATFTSAVSNLLADLVNNYQNLKPNKCCEHL